MFGSNPLISRQIPWTRWERQNKIWEFPVQSTVQRQGCIMDIHLHTYSTGLRTFLEQQQRWNSWKYNFVEVSVHNLESSQTWRFRIKRKTLQTFVPITSKNSASRDSNNLLHKKPVVFLFYLTILTSELCQIFLYTFDSITKFMHICPLP